MKSARAFASTLILTACVCVALAGNVTGKWNGRVVIDQTKIPKAQNEQQQKSREMMLGIISGTKFVLNLKSDKSWTLDANISAIGPNGKRLNQSHHVDGTWKMNGADVVLKTIHEDGKASQDKDPQVLHPINGGKVLKMIPPRQEKMPDFMTGVLFTRAR